MAAAPAPLLILAFDLGLRRIGGAPGDTLTRTAAARATLPGGPQGPPWDMIHSLVRDWQPTLAVVGLPYNADGSESAMSAAARGFAAELTRRCALPVTLGDERFSSLEAQARRREARESGLRKRRVAKADVDGAAACVILERWFSGST